MLKSARLRNELYTSIRSFFLKKDVLEVHTPILSKGASVDAHIDYFKIDESTYLSTSPELYMKRLLLRGYPSIFQIAKCFRQEEEGKEHALEFTILEWYRLNYSYKDLIQEIVEMIEFLFKEKMLYNMYDYTDVFLLYLELDINEISLTELEKFMKSKGISFPYDQVGKDDLLNYLFSLFIQPKLPSDQLSFVCNYPHSQASLAKIDPANTKVSFRFEFFYKGMELANGFDELQDGEEYYRRFVQQNEERKNNGKEEIVLDEKFIQEIKNKPLPNCSGVALGLDRLLMIMLEANSINDVLDFSFSS